MRTPTHERIKRAAHSQSPQKCERYRSNPLCCALCIRLSASFHSASKNVSYSTEQTVLCRSQNFTRQPNPVLGSSPLCELSSFPLCFRMRPQAPCTSQPHSPAACRCSLASLSMLKGSLGASRRSQDGHIEAPGHLFEALVGEGVTAARAACSWSMRDPTPIFKGSLGPLPVRDRKGRGGEMRRLD